MPNNAEHNRICEARGFDSNRCKEINKWMDAPSSEYPGCPHRNFRHSKKDCDFVAKEILATTNNVDISIEAEQICMLHRKIDRESDGCGCKPLFEE